MDFMKLCERRPPLKLFLSISASLLAGFLSVMYGTSVAGRGSERVDRLRVPEILFLVSSGGVELSTPSQNSTAVTDLTEERKPLQVAKALTKQALVFAKRRHYVKAEELLKRALSITSGKLGSDHPQVAVLFQKLATVYAVQGRYVEAERLLRIALEINEESLGPQHLDVAANLEALAFVLKREHQEEEAEQLAARASKIWDQYLRDVPQNMEGR
jgi:tetratricopeptide (TPR) repeat protein